MTNEFDGFFDKHGMDSFKVLIEQLKKNAEIEDGFTELNKALIQSLEVLDVEFQDALQPWREEQEQKEMALNVIRKMDQITLIINKMVSDIRNI